MTDDNIILIKFHSKYKPVKKQLEKYILNKITDTYLPFVRPNIEQLNAVLNDKNIESQIEKKYVTTNFICSIKSIYVKDIIIYTHGKIKNNIEEIADIYTNTNTDTSIDIYVISQLYLYPALILLKLIFQYKYSELTKKQLKQLFDLDTDTNTDTDTNANKPIKLSSCDYLNLKLAREIDEYSMVDESKQLIEATHFEHCLEQKLILHNIKYKTQEQLVKEQMEQFGKPISTPDFLLDVPIILDGIKIHWIDAKNFYGAYSIFLHNKIKDQTKKYLKNYGSGLIVFAHGYSHELQNNFWPKIKFAHIDDL